MVSSMRRVKCVQNTVIIGTYVTPKYDGKMLYVGLVSFYMEQGRFLLLVPSKYHITNLICGAV